MPDHRKAARLAGELAAELKLQGQMDGEIRDTLDQLLGESEELIELAELTTEVGGRGPQSLVSGEIIEDLGGSTAKWGAHPVSSCLRPRFFP